MKKEHKRLFLCTEIIEGGNETGSATEEIGDNLANRDEGFNLYSFHRKSWEWGTMYTGCF